MSHNEKYRKLINSTRWIKLRNEKMHNDPFCERCRERGRFVTATEVHHKVPVESVTDFLKMSFLAYDYSNLMSVCRKCHKELHSERHARARQESRRRRFAEIRERVRGFLRKAGNPGGDF